MNVEKWLTEPNAMPILLIDLFHSRGVKRIASQAYHSKPSDTTPNLSYDDFLDGGLHLSAAIGSNRCVGSFEFWDVDNACNNLEWLSYTAKIGDASWGLGEFYLLSTGLVEQAMRPERNKIRIDVADAAKALQSQILSAKIGDNLIPVALGNVFNASPIIEDAAHLIYRASVLPCTILAVRDNGVAVDGFIDYGNGSFKLNHSPAGQLTCDVVDGRNTVETACRWLANQKGYNVSQVINFTPSQSAAQVGVFITGNETAWEVMTQLCSSIGAFPRIDEAGNLQLVYVDHSSPAEYWLYDDDVWMDGIVQQSVIAPANVQLTYRKNWTVQSSVAGSVSSLDADLYARPTTTIEIDNAQPNREKQTIETLLSEKNHAVDEASRRGELWLKTREVWRISAILPGMSMQIGDRVGVITDVLSGIGTVVAWGKRIDEKEAEIELLI